MSSADDKATLYFNLVVKVHEESDGQVTESPAAAAAPAVPPEKSPPPSAPAPASSDSQQMTDLGGPNFKLKKELVDLIKGVQIGGTLAKGVEVKLPNLSPRRTRQRGSASRGSSEGASAEPISAPTPTPTPPARSNQKRVASFSFQKVEYQGMQILPGDFVEISRRSYQQCPALIKISELRVKQPKLMQVVSDYCRKEKLLLDDRSFVKTPAPLAVADSTDRIALVPPTKKIPNSKTWCVALNPLDVEIKGTLYFYVNEIWHDTNKEHERFESKIPVDWFDLSVVLGKCAVVHIYTPTRGSSIHAKFDEIFQRACKSSPERLYFARFHHWYGTMRRDDLSLTPAADTFRHTFCHPDPILSYPSPLFVWNATQLRAFEDSNWCARAGDSSEERRGYKTLREVLAHVAQCVHKAESNPSPAGATASTSTAPPPLDFSKISLEALSKTKPKPKPKEESKEEKSGGKVEKEKGKRGPKPKEKDKEKEKEKEEKPKKEVKTPAPRGRRKKSAEIPPEEQEPAKSSPSVSPVSTEPPTAPPPLPPQLSNRQPPQIEPRPPTPPLKKKPQVSMEEVEFEILESQLETVENQETIEVEVTLELSTPPQRPPSPPIPSLLAPLTPPRTVTEPTATPTATTNDFPTDNVEVEVDISMHDNENVDETPVVEEQQPQKSPPSPQEDLLPPPSPSPPSSPLPTPPAVEINVTDMVPVSPPVLSPPPSEPHDESMDVVVQTHAAPPELCAPAAIPATTNDFSTDNNTTTLQPPEVEVEVEMYSANSSPRVPTPPPLPAVEIQPTDIIAEEEEPTAPVLTENEKSEQPAPALPLSPSPPPPPPPESLETATVTTTDVDDAREIQLPPPPPPPTEIPTAVPATTTTNAFSTDMLITAEILSDSDEDSTTRYNVDMLPGPSVAPPTSRPFIIGRRAQAPPTTTTTTPAVHPQIAPLNIPIPIPVMPPQQEVVEEDSDEEVLVLEETDTDLFSLSLGGGIPISVGISVDHLSPTAAAAASAAPAVALPPVPMVDNGNADFVPVSGLHFGGQVAEAPPPPPPAIPTVGDQSEINSASASAPDQTPTISDFQHQQNDHENESFYVEEEFTILEEEHHMGDGDNGHLEFPSMTNFKGQQHQDQGHGGETGAADKTTSVLLVQVQESVHPTVDSVRNVFRIFGKVQKISIFEVDGFGYSFVEFGSPEEALNSKQALEGRSTILGKITRIQFCTQTDSKDFVALKRMSQMECQQKETEHKLSQTQTSLQVALMAKQDSDSLHWTTVDSLQTELRKLKSDQISHRKDFEKKLTIAHSATETVRKAKEESEKQWKAKFEALQKDNKTLEDALIHNHKVHKESDSKHKATAEALQEEIKTLKNELSLKNEAKEASEAAHKTAVGALEEEIKTLKSTIDQKDKAQEENDSKAKATIHSLQTSTNDLQTLLSQKDAEISALRENFEKSEAEKVELKRKLEESERLLALKTEKIAMISSALTHDSPQNHHQQQHQLQQEPPKVVLSLSVPTPSAASVTPIQPSLPFQAPLQQPFFPPLPMQPPPVQPEPQQQQQQQSDTATTTSTHHDVASLLWSMSNMETHVDLSLDLFNEEGGGSQQKKVAATRKRDRKKKTETSEEEEEEPPSEDALDGPTSKRRRKTSENASRAASGRQAKKTAESGSAAATTKRKRGAKK